ncbi:LAQU0S26e00738g1_1 [Lachancea quebecensis]|uniref:Enhancer of polycomb-like protein n=1 Tax=Lachancea quebecensis TaxID=1654605 RepID=A0A0P1KY59_9SACH|nr:LAQU0S26e00738g1_1 [Lachancea quebecensis]
MAAPSSQEAANTRFRHRKISVKQRLQVYKASDLRKLDKDELQQRELVEIETGVEKNEEKEEHLHKILQRNQLTRKELYIPTPDASQTWGEYEDFYRGKFEEPVSYIRFSATVEDCCGSCYNMDERDERFLDSKVNNKLKGDEKLSETEFELMCSSLEAAIHERQPFLSIDPENILSLEEIKPTILKRDLGDAGIKDKLAEEIGVQPQQFITQFDSAVQQDSRPITVLFEKFGKQIYNYWKGRKIEAHGGEISPQLKSERPGDRDDNDPYVCFRRREVRQARKTRRVDYQNSHKLRLLHQQLLYTKKLALLVAKREKAFMDMLENDQRVFELRRDIKPIKRSAVIIGDDDLFVDQKKRRLISNVIASTALESNPKKLRAKSKKASADAVNPKAAVATKPQSRGSQTQSQQSAQQLHAQQQALLQQQQAQQQAQQQKQQANTIAAHVYVKLPTSKIPDILLEDVDDILLKKERSARSYVEERMRKRKLEDGDRFFNLTDDPYNPVFDISIPSGVSPANAPFSSIASSKFEIEKSYYVPGLENYMEGKADDVLVLNRDGDRIENPKYRKIERYRPFQQNSGVHTRELPFRLRRRVGRLGLEYIDRRRPPAAFEPLSSFINLTEVEKQERENDVIDVYDSKLDALSRLHDRWKHDSDYNDHGTKFSHEPARLNQISNDTQVIRFGTMLGTKSYEQLRDATFKYRQEIYNQRRTQKNSTSQKHPRANGTIPASASTTSMSSTPARTSSSSSIKRNSNTKQHVTSIN